MESPQIFYYCSNQEILMNLDVPNSREVVPLFDYSTNPKCGCLVLLFFHTRMHLNVKCHCWKDPMCQLVTKKSEFHLQVDLNLE